MNEQEAKNITNETDEMAAACAEEPMTASTCSSEEAAEAREPKGDGHRKRNVAIGIACAVATACLAGGVGWALTGSGAAKPEEPSVAVAQGVASHGAVDAKIGLKVDAPGWSDTSSPVIAHIESEDGSVNYYHAMAANAQEELKAREGDYKITLVSPINADGSIYEVGESAKVAVGSDGASHDMAVKPVPADQVTQEQLSAILDAMKDAVARGDASLSGSAGQAVVDKTSSNAAAAPNADKSKVDAAAEEAKGRVSEEPAATEPAAEAPSSAVSQAPAQGPSEPAAAPSAPAGFSGSAQKTWVVDYAQQWVPNVVTVVDQAAWTESVPVYSTIGRSICNTCGADVTGFEASHAEQHVLAGQNGGHHEEWIQTITGYNSVYHGAVTHTEDQGHYETVEAGGHWE